MGCRLSHACKEEKEGGTRAEDKCGTKERVHCALFCFEFVVQDKLYFIETCWQTLNEEKLSLEKDGLKQCCS